MIAADMIDIIVNLKAADQVDGGLSQLRNFMQGINQTYRDDGNLAVVSFMSGQDADELVGELIKLGLRYDKQGVETDIALFELHGCIPYVHPAWLTRSTHNQRQVYSLTGSEPGALVKIKYVETKNKNTIDGLNENIFDEL